MFENHLKNKSPEEIQQKLRELESKSDFQQYDYNQYEDIKVEILPDKTLGPARFKPSQIQPGIWYAHPTTIRAMKKNILASGEDVDETVIEYDCFKCNAKLDAQFWVFCPHCEAMIDL